MCLRAYLKAALDALFFHQPHLGDLAAGAGPVPAPDFSAPDMELNEAKLLAVPRGLSPEPRRSAILVATLGNTNLKGYWRRHTPRKMYAC